MKSYLAFAVFALINNTSAKSLSLLEQNAPIGYIMMQTDPAPAEAVAGTPPPPEATPPGTPDAPPLPVADPSAGLLAGDAKAAEIPASANAPSAGSASPIPVS